MDKYANLFEYFRQCPQLQDLWSIAAVEERGVRVIFPQGASPANQYQEKIDILGNYIYDIVPYPSIYEDFQINCYEWYDVNDDREPYRNKNVLTLEEVTKICEWVAEQSRNNNFPDIGEKIISVECLPNVPQIRYVNPEESTVGYFITVRIRWVNRAERKTVEYEDIY